MYIIEDYKYLTAAIVAAIRNCITFWDCPFTVTVFETYGGRKFLSLSKGSLKGK